MNKTFGEVVKKARESKGLSQHHLALLCNTSVQNLKKVEEDKVIPRDTTVAKLAMHLDLDLMETLILTPHFSNDMSELAKIVIIARLKKGLSKKALAQKCNINVTELSNIEFSKSITPYFATLRKIASALDLDVSILNQAAGYIYSDEVKDIGSLIKNLRVRASLSQFECAIICEISQSSLSQIERGITKKPQKEFLEKFSVCSNCNLSILLAKAGYSEWSWYK